MKTRRIGNYRLWVNIIIVVSLSSISSCIKNGKFSVCPCVPPTSVIEDPQSAHIEIDAEASVVHVRTSSENGRGLTRRHGGECFVITPFHVVDSYEDITVTAPNRIEASASIQKEYRTSSEKEDGGSEDIAILKVENETSQICQNDHWATGEDLSGILGPQKPGTLVLRLPFGGLKRIPIRVVEVHSEFLRISPDSDSNQIEQGMSGGLLRLGNTSAGLLLDVNTDLGQGKVMRQDYLNSRVTRFFAQRFTEQEIRSWLENYRQAYETGNTETLLDDELRYFLGPRASEFRKEFDTYGSITLTLEDEQFDIRGNRATVKFTQIAHINEVPQAPVECTWNLWKEENGNIRPENPPLSLHCS